MGRQLDTVALDGAARHYAASFLRPDRRSREDGPFIDGPSYVMQDLYNAHFKDEHEYLVAGVKDWMGRRALEEFDRLASNHFTPRDEGVFHGLLAERLAINPEGEHKPGAIGKVIVGQRFMGFKDFEVETLESVRRRKRLGLPIHDPNRTDRETHIIKGPWYWPIYAGETDERVAGSGVADPLPPGTPGMPVGATNTIIANVAAIAACDAVVDYLDVGSTAATIRGRTGTQPTDVDSAETGTLLFTLTCSDPAFGAASDAAPGATATASAITDDSSADATGTLGYCRGGATGTGADDIIDGSVGTSAADFIFNTLSIVAGAVISMSSWTVTMPES